MRKLIRIAVITGILLQSGITVMSQPATVKQGKQTPKWVSPLGYWVIESNIKKPGISVIYYYRKDNQLVHKETVIGTTLNTKNKKVKMKLKETLERAIENFEETAWSGKKE